MPNTYKTSEVAKITGIHPNTVRLYEEMELISKPERKDNGYRVFNDLHIEQFRLARIALQVEVIQNGLRKMAIDIVKTSASGNLDKAEEIAENYLNKIKSEQVNAIEAIEIVEQLLSGKKREERDLSLTRKQAAEFLQITMDTLRNWELNGLLNVKRKHNGYRIYNNDDIRQLKIIRSLRCANYSLSAILRLLNELSFDPHVNIAEVIDTPNESDSIISVCDKLLTSLHSAEINAERILLQLAKMKDIK